MDIIKIFTNADNISRALGLMMKYPYDERPLIRIVYTEYDLGHYAEGTLYSMELIDSYITITIKTIYDDKLDINEKSITKLYIYDTREV